MGVLKIHNFYHFLQRRLLVSANMNLEEAYQIRGFALLTISLLTRNMAHLFWGQ